MSPPPLDEDDSELEGDDNDGTDRQLPTGSGSGDAGGVPGADLEADFAGGGSLPDEWAAQVPPALAGERLDRALALLTGLTRATAAQLVDAGKVTVGRRVVTTRSHRLQESSHLVVDLSGVERPGPTSALPADPSVVVPVVWQDEHVLVVDKPAGLVVHPGAGTRGGTLVQGLLARFPELAALALAEGEDPLRPGIVHRLDKGTSGLLVVARSAVALEDLRMQLRERQASRTYLAVAHGFVEASEGLIDAPLGRSSREPTKMAVRADGRVARTRYEVVARSDAVFPVTLVRCHLDTGRTHQIRVHLAAIGHPVVADDRYAPLARQREARSALAKLQRPWLHAAQLGFRHPVTGEPLSFTSAVPGDLAEAARRLGLPADTLAVG